MLAGRSTRDLNCPPSLLQRITKLCNHHNLYFIWIDQECIYQEDIEDKQVGIRAMDSVYQQAELCVAVLEVCLIKQRHVDALEPLRSAPEEISYETLVNILETLELILEDSWFSRVWCLQEALAGSSDMVLLVSYAQGLEVHDLFEQVDNILIRLMKINIVIHTWLAIRLETRHDGVPVLEARGNQVIDRWFNGNAPDVIDPAGIDSRFICSAADAMVLLQDRHNSITSDRLANLTNLCGYERRPLGLEIEVAGHNFSVSVLAVAILNGDISLLEQYHGLRNRASKAVQSGLGQGPPPAGYGFAWCPPAQASLAAGYPPSVTENFVFRMDVLSLSLRGLYVNGCIWVADRELDLESSEYDDQTLGEVLRPKTSSDIISGKHQPRVTDTILGELANYSTGADTKISLGRSQMSGIQFVQTNSLPFMPVLEAMVCFLRSPSGRIKMCSSALGKIF